VSPSGEILRTVKMPERMPTNICFGGPDMRTAYITLSNTGKLVAMQWDEPGLRIPYN
jgi:gluconolactonase